MAHERILVVEDEVLVAELIEQYLKRAGYSISARVSTGEEALQEAGRLRPDLALMDIKLTGQLDGVQTAERLLNRFNIPVVFLSGMSDDVTLQRSQTAEAFGYLVKPFRPEELKASIDLALSKHKAESKLRKIEHWFTAAIKSIGDAVITTDTDGVIKFINPVAELLTGWRLEQALDRDLMEVLQVVDGQTRQRCPNPVARVLHDGLAPGKGPQVVLISKTGAEIPIDETVAPIRDDQQRTIGAVLVFRDVTKRQQAESALRESEERYRLLVDLCPDALLVQSGGLIVLSNTAGAKLLGAKTSAELIGRPFRDFIHSDSRPAVEDRMRALNEGQAVPLLGLKFLRLDGFAFEVEVSAVLLSYHDQPAVQLVVRDITERRRAEFRNAQIARLGHGLNATNTPLEAARIITEIAGNLVGWDVCSLDLYAPEEDLITPLLTVDTIDGQNVESASANRHRQPSPLVRRVLRDGAELVLRDGPPEDDAGLIPLGNTSRPSKSLMFVPIRNGEKVAGIMSVQSYSEKAYSPADLSVLQSLADHCGGALERIRAREALRESEERFHAFMKYSPVAAFIKDEAGRYLYCNWTWADHFKKRPFDLLDKTDFDLWPEFLAQRFLQSDLATFATHDPQTCVESSFQPDGKPIHWLLLKFLICDSAGQKLLGGLALDISEQKRAEAELNDSREQLRSLAAHLQSVREEERIRIAREIHDELGQMLTGFKMDLAWMEKRLSPANVPPVQAALLDKVKSMTQLANDMVQSVRRISADLRPGVLDNLGLVPALEWQAREFQKRTGIDTQFVSGLEEMNLSPDLCTVVFRICQETLTNVARHAQATAVTINLESKDGHLILEVKDNGRGITEKELLHSKSFGLLGMRERAMSLGGEFNIHGSPSQGTAVTVKVPLRPTSALSLDSAKGLVA